MSRPMIARVLTVVLVPSASCASTPRPESPPPSVDTDGAGRASIDSRSSAPSLMSLCGTWQVEAQNQAHATTERWWIAGDGLAGERRTDGTPGGASIERLELIADADGRFEYVIEAEDGARLELSAIDLDHSRRTSLDPPAEGHLWIWANDLQRFPQEIHYVMTDETLEVFGHGPTEMAGPGTIWKGIGVRFERVAACGG